MLKITIWDAIAMAAAIVSFILALVFFNIWFGHHPLDFASTAAYNSGLVSI